MNGRITLAGAIVTVLFAVGVIAGCVSIIILLLRGDLVPRSVCRGIAQLVADKIG